MLTLTVYSTPQRTIYVLISLRNRNSDEKRSVFLPATSTTTSRTKIADLFALLVLSPVKVMLPWFSLARRTWILRAFQAVELWFSPSLCPPCHPQVCMSGVVSIFLASPCEGMDHVDCDRHENHGSGVKRGARSRFSRPSGSVKIML